MRNCKRSRQQIALYARVSPEHKLRIVRAHQAIGSVVCMTGDGVNDAPALKQADMGVAMGITGTDVSKGAARMVLADDNFASIVAAVEEGRLVYDNIRRCVMYLLTTNAGEILVTLATISFGLPLGLLPIHLLWINLITDGLPAPALAYEEANPGVMEEKPRPRDESIFAGGLAYRIAGYGTLVRRCASESIGISCGNRAGLTSRNRSVTLARLCLSRFPSASCSLRLGLRGQRASFSWPPMLGNWRLTGAWLLGIVLQLLVVYVPQLQAHIPHGGSHLARSSARQRAVHCRPCGIRAGQVLAQPSTPEERQTRDRRRERPGSPDRPCPGRSLKRQKCAGQHHRCAEEHTLPETFPRPAQHT